MHGRPKVHLVDYDVFTDELAGYKSSIPLQCKTFIVTCQNVVSTVHKLIMLLVVQLQHPS